MLEGLGEVTSAPDPANLREVFCDRREPLGESFLESLPAADL